MPDTPLHNHWENPWHPGRRWRRVQLDPRLRGWLLDTSSLTRRLQQCCAGHFRVRLDWQGWARPALDECQALGLRRRQRALVREVHLLCNDIPWVFARTVIPRASLRGRERRLAHLGERPLGAVLFADPRMQRGEVEVARIDPGTALHAHALGEQGAEAGPVWGRRSVFWLGRKPLLVSEIFLDTMDCPNGA
ncbi:chorismate--pyruvate lyase family protein [Thiohalobacter thiocyanaticus]|uniref:chorismate--pyruvate lyase family protein n=1 Tax=Thiohalobacter thiocyanaticus TaxID=585455 RepID=UPI00131A15FC|nr:chorismate lyase [Thiohalobacter thiocyanaticus]